MDYKVVATALDTDTPEVALKTFDSLDGALAWRPVNEGELISAGFTHFMIVPEGWVDTKFGAAPGLCITELRR